MSGNILVATDLSARSDRAVERALLLGRQLGRGVTLLHVLEGDAQLDHEQEERLRGIVETEFGLSGQPVEVRFEKGDVPEAIAGFAEREDCALVVTGVARFNDVRDFVLGTAVDYLVRKSPRPVLVVKRRARQPYQRLVVATDFSPASARALLLSAELFPDAKLKLVHAYRAAFEAFLERDSTAEFVRDEAEEAIGKQVAELPEAFRPRVETVVEEGRVEAVLARQVNELGGELLVLGSWHRRRHAHFMGSEDSWAMPGIEPCDLLIVRPGMDKARADDEAGTGEAAARE
ncbi:MAG TPA: universal stress protein [Sphingomicrobium sp.]|nr:universal stress protein [Sphingomicrobium sp.]